MKKIIGLAAVAVLFASTPVFAKGKPVAGGGGSTPDIIDADCFSVFGANGCKFDGVVNAQSDADALELEYNGLNGGFTPNTDIDLQLLAKINVGDFGSSLTFIQTKPGEPGEIISATYTNNNWLIDYIAIKAGNTAVLFAANGTNSVSWNTQRLGGKGMSHLVFFGRPMAVPEPATWAMMIGGFGLLGAAARRRKDRTVLA